MKRQCDPNGIRTRVTAVKGRCPGPLDDRVTKAEQYQNCYSWTQGKLRSLFRALMRQTRQLQRLQPRMKFVNQCRCASSCTVMLAQNVARVLQKALARLAVAQKLGDRHFK